LESPELWGKLRRLFDQIAVVRLGRTPQSSHVDFVPKERLSSIALREFWHRLRVFSILFLASTLLLATPYFVVSEGFWRRARDARSGPSPSGPTLIAEHPPAGGEISAMESEAYGAGGEGGEAGEDSSAVGEGSSDESSTSRGGAGVGGEGGEAGETSSTAGEDSSDESPTPQGEPTGSARDDGQNGTEPSGAGSKTGSDDSRGGGHSNGGALGDGGGPSDEYVQPDEPDIPSFDDEEEDEPPASSVTLEPPTPGQSIEVEVPPMAPAHGTAEDTIGPAGSSGGMPPYEIGESYAPDSEDTTPFPRLSVQRIPNWILALLYSLK
jgi:hypothetical protein